jgi:hypothetical protein
MSSATTGPATHNMTSENTQLLENLAIMVYLAFVLRLQQVAPNEKLPVLHSRCAVAV